MNGFLVMLFVFFLNNQVEGPSKTKPPPHFILWYSALIVPKCTFYSTQFRIVRFSKIAWSGSANELQRSYLSIFSKIFLFLVLFFFCLFIPITPLFCFSLPYTLFSTTKVWNPQLSHTLPVPFPPDLIWDLCFCCDYVPTRLRGLHEFKRLTAYTPVPGALKTNAQTQIFLWWKTFSRSMIPIQFSSYPPRSSSISL